MEDGATATASLPKFGAIEVVSGRPEKHVFRVAPLNNSVYLVVNETLHHGWHATVDGQETPVLLANHRAMAVPVPAGSREAAMQYTPPRFFPGLAASLTGVILAVVLVLFGKRAPSSASNAVAG